MNKQDQLPRADSTSKSDESNKVTISKTLAISIEFGFIIILPLLAFVYAGKWLEGRYHNRLFVIGGVVLALLASTIWFYMRIQEIYDDFIK